MRRSSGGERAWFLEEESEPRNKRIFLAGENSRADESAYLTAFEIITEIEILTNLCSTIDGGKEYELL
jgi:hypothetical protein